LIWYTCGCPYEGPDGFQECKPNTTCAEEDWGQLPDRFMPSDCDICKAAAAVAAATAAAALAEEVAEDSGIEMDDAEEDSS